MLSKHIFASAILYCICTLNAMAQGYQSEFGLGAYQQGARRGQEDAIQQEQRQMNQLQIVQQVAAMIKQKCQEDGFSPGTPEFSECTNKHFEAFAAKMQSR